MRILSIFKRKKGIYDLHPELYYRLPILRYSSDDGAEPQMNYKIASIYYASNIWVHKAIRVLRDNIAPLRLEVLSKQDLRPIPNHKLSDILELPNPMMDSASFWGEWVVHMCLGGESGIEIVLDRNGKLAEMWLREPSVLYIKPGKFGRRYMSVEAYKIDDGAGDPYILSPAELCHIKYYNPLNAWRGIAPITAVRMSVVIDQLAQAWTRLFFKNQARPDYAVIAPEGLTKTEKEELIKQLVAEYGGGENVHKPIILEQGVTDIKTFSFPPKDIEWIEQRKLSRDEIGAIFGVPDEIMGYGRDTYENFDTADRVLWTLTIVPMIRLRDSALTQFFRMRGDLTREEIIQTNLTSIQQLQTDHKSKIEQAKILFDMGYPINDINRWLGLRLPIVEGGDVGYISWGLSPAIHGEYFGKRIKAVGPKGVFEYGSPEHEIIWKRHQSRLDQYVDEMKRGLKRYFQRQQNDIVRNLRNSRDFGRGKQEGGDIPNLDGLFNLDEESRKFVETFLGLIKRAISNVAAQELEEANLRINFWVDNPLVLDGIKHILETVARKTNETTWYDLIDIFQEAESAGEGILAIQERLSAYFGDRKSDWQTERIARTTMTGATNYGNLEAMKIAQDELKEKITKTWISALLPGRTREAHWNAHGQTVGLNEAYNVGGEMLMYPGDPSGSPENIINCLCSEIFDFEEK